MLVARFILYVQMHVSVTKVKIAKTQLILATKVTAMIKSHHFFVLTFFLRHFDSATFQIIVTDRNKIRVGK